MQTLYSSLYKINIMKINSTKSFILSDDSYSPLYMSLTVCNKASENRKI